MPLRPVLEAIEGITALGLTLPAFGFTRSDSFVEGRGDAPDDVAILDLAANGTVRCKYNAYRTYLRDDAPPMARNALEAFVAAVGHAECIKVHLDNSTAVLINNYAALHGRDLVEDNRRLLIRLFGYSDDVTDVTYVAASEAPLVVNG